MDMPEDVMTALQLASESGFKVTADGKYFYLEKGYDLEDQPFINCSDIVQFMRGYKFRKSEVKDS